MRKLSVFEWLLLLPALLLLLLCLGLIALVLSFAPPAVAWAAFGVFIVGLLWFTLVRRRSAVAGSESALMGRQSTKGGLL